MKTNELKIGNLVKSNQIVYSVISVNINKEVRGVDCGTTFNLDSTVEPIPLTEEWLLKFGFEKLGVSDYFYISSQNMNLKISPDLKMIAWHNLQLHGVIIKHVHQLQNLYFALTGGELEIK